MKKIIQVALAMSIFFTFSYAVAKWVGQYYCKECRFDTPIISDESFIFKKTVIDHDVSSWIDSKQAPNTVTICNGSECALYRYVALSGLLALVNTYADDWVGSRIPGDVDPSIPGNGIVGSGGGGGMCGGGPQGSFETTVVGYTPIYRTATVTTPGGSSSQQVLVGYEPVYGIAFVGNNEAIAVC